ncbi:ROK family protein [Mycolicibacterium senegalense]|uniref:ROK family protein n=1 Tax=Mycolicibacterium senegalense TaxID=1796 RepID=UPI003AAB4FF0
MKLHSAHQAFQNRLNCLVEESSVGQEVLGVVMARTSQRAPAETTRVEIAAGNRSARRAVDQREIPQATVSKAVKVLKASGLLENGEKLIMSTEGRPLMPLRLGRGLAIAGVHVEQQGNRPSMITTALVGLDSAVLFADRSDEVPDDDVDMWQSAARLVHTQVTELMETLDKQRANDGVEPLKLFGVGAEVGAPVFEGNIMPLPGVHASRTVAFADMLRDLFDDTEQPVPVVVENDVNALAVLAIHEDHYAEPDLAVVAVFPQGVGGGLVMDGRLRRGGQGKAMEVGHLVVGYAPGDRDPDTRAETPRLQDAPAASVGFDDPCWCGESGHVDTLATPARIAGELGMPFDVATALTNVDPRYDRAHGVFKRAGSVLGRAIAHVCNVVNPSKLIVYLPDALAKADPETASAAYYRAVKAEIETAFAVVGKPINSEDDDPAKFLQLRSVPADPEKAALLGARSAAVCVLESFIEHALRLDACSAKGG